MTAVAVRIDVRAGLFLEGRKCGGSLPACIIAPPHPEYGGTQDSPVVRALEDAFAAAGYSTLAFNFQGTGESDGAPSGDFAHAVEDYLAAARHVADQGVATLSGYSFGAATAVRAAAALNASSLLLVAPPIGMLDLAALAAFKGTLVVVAAAYDEYAPPEALTKVLEDCAPQAQLTIVDDSNHFFLGNGARRLAEALRGVVQRRG